MGTVVNKPVVNTPAKPIAKENANSMDAKLTVEAPKMTKEQRQQLKADNFKRLATRRTKQAVKQINNLSQLGNKNAYSYTDEQLDKIFGAIDNAVRDLKQSFSAAGQSKEFEISL